MPGQQLNNYDLVVEFSNQAINDLLSAFFDTISPIGNILHQISGGIIPGLAFAMTVSFAVPTDISLPPGTIDVIDINMTLGTDGSVGSLRFVARVDVNHATTLGVETDIVQIDLSPSGLLYTTLDLYSVLNSTNGALTTALHSLGSIPLLPVPVNRTSTSPVQVVSADMRIIDDTSQTNLDDAALLLTFGGDSPGNRNGFTQGFVPPGDKGAIGISFNWICNIIRPQIASGLGIPVTDFSAPCHLNTSINLPGDHNPQLTGLDLTLVNGAINVSASVGASDTGWSASATVGGSITIAIVNGNLVINSNIANPQISVSLDWWVWLAAAVVGAIVGGIIAGVIGAVIGAIIVPIIVWLASNVINGIIQNVANQIVNALRQLNLNVDVPAIGVNIVFQDISIDDIIVGAGVQFTDNAPIRSQGQVVVYDGQRVDLDNGSVGDSSLPGADLAWVGRHPNRSLETLCCELLARTGGTVFDLTRSQLYRLYYETGISIPESELGNWQGSTFDPSDLVYAVETDEGRFSIIQVVNSEFVPPLSSIGYEAALATSLPAVTAASATNTSSATSAAPGKVATTGRSNQSQGRLAVVPGFNSGISGVTSPTGYIVLRYRTFEKPAPFVKTVGGTGVGTIAGSGEGTKLGTVIGSSGASLTEPGKGIVGVDIPVANAVFAPSSGSSQNSMNPGIWQVNNIVKNPKHKTIKALTPGIQVQSYNWSINRNQLQGNSGSVKVGGSTVKYQISGDKITVTGEAASATNFEVSVSVVAKDGTQQVVKTCVETGGESSVNSIATASWPVFQENFVQVFGNIDP